MRLIVLDGLGRTRRVDIALPVVAGGPLPTTYTPKQLSPWSCLGV
jgi:hypothetical protein